MKKSLLAALSMCFLVLQVQAQFSYNPYRGKFSDRTMTIKLADSVRSSFLELEATDVKAENTEVSEKEIEEELTILRRYLAFTRNDYQKIKARVAAGDSDSELRKKLSDKEYAVYILHTYQEKFTEITCDCKTKPKIEPPITAQGIAGANLVTNSVTDETSGLFELGARINNTRISLPSSFRYNVKKSGDTYSLERYQRSRYLYLTFISRGVLTLDSLQNTMSEYVSSTLGSPLTARVSLQNRLGREWGEVTGIREPSFYYSLDFDARVVPVTSATKIEEGGASFHFAPSLLAIFPSGESHSLLQDEDFIVQFTLNAAVLTDNLEAALTPKGAESPLKRNTAVSSELRVGNYSRVNPLRNWSVFAKMSFYDLIGPKFSIGYTFAPRGKEPKITDEETEN